MPDIDASAAAVVPIPSPVAVPPAATGRTTLKTSKFKVPGEGSSVGISVVTVITLIVLWFLVTNLGWVKPLFLPKPQAVAQQFYEYLMGTANDKPLWQQYLLFLKQLAQGNLGTSLTYQTPVTELVIGAIPIERSKVTRRSADQAAELIDDGWSMLIFPEGGRSPDGWGQPFRGGAAYLSSRCSSRPCTKDSTRQITQ